MIVSHNPENKRKMAKTISLLIDYKNNIPEFIQIFLVDRLLWASTEYDDNEKWNKYFGIPYWSKGAILKVMGNIANGVKPDKELIHEHSTPKCVLGDKLDVMYKNKTTSENDIFLLLDRFCHAVVVSREEDARINYAGLRSRMPDTFSFSDNADVFCRYRQAGIEVYLLNTQELSELSKGIVREGQLNLLTRNRIC